MVGGRGWCVIRSSDGSVTPLQFTNGHIRSRIHVQSKTGYPSSHHASMPLSIFERWELGGSWHGDWNGDGQWRSRTELMEASGITNGTGWPTAFSAVPGVWARASKAQRWRLTICVIALFYAFALLSIIRTFGVDRREWQEGQKRQAG